MSVWCVCLLVNKMLIVMGVWIEKYCVYLFGCCSIERKKSFKILLDCREWGLKVVNV